VLAVLERFIKVLPQSFLVRCLFFLYLTFYISVSIPVLLIAVRLSLPCRRWLQHLFVTRETLRQMILQSPAIMELLPQVRPLRPERDAVFAAVGTHEKNKKKEKYKRQDGNIEQILCESAKRFG
jgi:hypothetical protein